MNASLYFVLCESAVFIIMANGYATDLHLDDPLPKVKSVYRKSRISVQATKVPDVYASNCTHSLVEIFGVESLVPSAAKEVDCQRALLQTLLDKLNKQTITSRHMKKPLEQKYGCLVVNTGKET